jgi:hypothetical protein
VKPHRMFGVDFSGGQAAGPQELDRWRHDRRRSGFREEVNTSRGKSTYCGPQSHPGLLSALQYLSEAIKGWANPESSRAMDD